MYRISPRYILDTGFYALHYGGLSNKETLESFHKVAYDFVIGKTIEPYQSFEVIKQRNDLLFSQYATKLLNQVNDLFNSKKYNEIRKIYYKSDGSKYNDSEWKTMVEGFENWFIQSGKIQSSMIVNHSTNENQGTFSIQTKYEKAGIINEELTILKKDNSFFITFIGTK